jgi:hypothetical protein
LQQARKIADTLNWVIPASIVLGMGIRQKNWDAIVPYTRRGGVPLSEEPGSTAPALDKPAIATERIAFNVPLARSAFHDSNFRIKRLASFAITVMFLDGVVFVQTLEAFGFGNGLVLSLESLPIDLRVGPANMVVIHNGEYPRSMISHQYCSGSALSRSEGNI